MGFVTGLAKSRDGGIDNVRLDGLDLLVIIANRFIKPGVKFSTSTSARNNKGMVVLGKSVTNVDFGQLTSHGVLFPFKNC
tara:strand:- start:63 stop:302 length:240 start_codon:yes stop_codon:yes gene_type:complete